MSEVSSVPRLGPDGITRGPIVERRTAHALEPRLPPGQTRTQKWPVLQYGSVPRFDRARWDFRVIGEVARPLRLSYEQLVARPRVELTCDIHCVTHWSRFGTVFEGVSVAKLLQEAEPLPAARFAVIHAEQGYTTNVPIETLLDPDTLLADWADGAPLAPEHGYPLRLVIPDRYFWKSAKWVRGIELVREDRPGFWERAGYHNNADPWREERFGE
jgi:DMSO/TMAO reductase YedYZ molybdopterin-dependent catalytic subunit